MELEVIRLAAAARREGEPAALCTVTRTWGHCPREVGAKMLVFRDGRSYGTIGGGYGEAEVRRLALQAIDSARPVLHVVELLDDPSASGGSVCGGKMEVFIEPLVRKEVPQG